MSWTLRSVVVVSLALAIVPSANATGESSTACMLANAVDPTLNAPATQIVACATSTLSATLQCTSSRSDPNHCFGTLAWTASGRSPVGVPGQLTWSAGGSFTMCTPMCRTAVLPAAPETCSWDLLSTTGCSSGRAGYSFDFGNILPPAGTCYTLGVTGAATASASPIAPVNGVLGQAVAHAAGEDAASFCG